MCDGSTSFDILSYVILAASRLGYCRLQLGGSRQATAPRNINIAVPSRKLELDLHLVVLGLSHEIPHLLRAFDIDMSPRARPTPATPTERCPDPLSISSTESSESCPWTPSTASRYRPARGPWYRGSVLICVPHPLHCLPPAGYISGKSVRHGHLGWLPRTYKCFQG